MSGGAHSGLVNDDAGGSEEGDAAVVDDAGGEGLVGAADAGSAVGNQQVMLSWLKCDAAVDGRDRVECRAAAAGTFEQPAADIDRCAGGVVKFDELVPCAVGAAGAKFADDNIRRRGKGGC